MVATAVATVLAVALGLVAGPVRAAPEAPVEATAEKIKLNFWISELSPRTKGFQRALREYERFNPHIRINTQLIPLLANEGVMDAQKLMCGVAGGSPPDIIEQDRFSIGDWAARGAFMALDEMIEMSQGTERAVIPKEFYPACWNEAVYDGKVYGIPNRTDARALYYNKDLLEARGLVDEKGEAKPPATWTELRRYVQILTEFDHGERVKHAGFLPLWGNSWLYLYGWQNGGRFMSEDGRTCTLNDPKIVGALEYLEELYGLLGGRNEAQVFENTFQTEAADPFLIGKISMRIDVDAVLQIIAQYRPNMRFGVAPPPVPEGQPATSWSGGFSFAIPNGARYPAESWKLIQYLVTREGALYAARAQRSYNRSRGKPFVPTIAANRKVAQEIIDLYGPKEPNLRAGLQTFLDLMPKSKFRPVTPAGQLLWDNQVKATEDALRDKRTADEALTYWGTKVQDRLDALYTEAQYPRVQWDLLAQVGGGCIAVFVLGLLIYFMRRPLTFRRRREALAAMVFISPWLIGFVFLYGGPILASIVLSFCKYDVLHPAEYVGFDNYIEMLTRDSTFWYSLSNTVYMMASVPLALAIGLALAMLVSSEDRGIALFRTLFYLPAIVPVVASSMIWLWLLNPRMGLVNMALAQMGIEGPNWFVDETWSKPSIILMLLWGSGASMVIWLAGLKGVPDHLYEAAWIDGAGHWGQFRNVTLPMLSPYVFFNLIMGIIATFQIFAQAYIMTNGGPADSTLFFVFYLFNQAYKYLRMGYASAMAWVLFLIILALTVLNLKLAPRWVHYEGEQN